MALGCTSFNRSSSYRMTFDQSDAVKYKTTKCHPAKHISKAKLSNLHKFIYTCLLIEIKPTAPGETGTYKCVL